MGDETATLTPIPDLVLQFATTHLGTVVGRGECWDLPYQALLAAHAHTPRDLGRGLYVWGEPVASLADAEPGDIIQFRNVRIRRTWTSEGGEEWEEIDLGSRHSAVIESIDGEGFVTLLHANYNRDRHVRRIRLNLSGENIAVHGQYFIYRGIPRS